ncbi:MAG TPA: peroxidase family protein, partial [Actinomycetes bacterium]|nr:peroxidase family protein [Actinomycetes bacterium]
TKRPPGKGDDNDLFREGPSTDKQHDRAAVIGDPRNDENLIIAQLHLAFLKAHNRLVDLGRTFEEARRLLRQHYQQIVLHDFLKRIANPAIVDAVITDGNRFYDAMDEPFFLPSSSTWPRSASATP